MTFRHLEIQLPTLELLAHGSLFSEPIHLWGVSEDTEQAYIWHCSDLKEEFE